jgi:hypothetical protein
MPMCYFSSFLCGLLSTGNYGHYANICYYIFIFNVIVYGWDETQDVVNTRLITNH